MKVHYIKHSGFLLEWEKSTWLFDYYQGEIPKIDKEKRVLVFVSHSHADHFNPEIFKLFADYPRVTYILSADTRYPVKKLELPKEVYEKIVFVKPYTELEEEDGSGGKILIHTLRSTDQGVAFLVDYDIEGLTKRIYHAGDLNWWVWKEESKQEYGNMTAKFKKEMGLLKELTEDKRIDTAFIPLDPRQGDWYRLGLEYFCDEIGADQVFPMHFWEAFDVIRKYRDMVQEKPWYHTIVIPEETR